MRALTALPTRLKKRRALSAEDLGQAQGDLAATSATKAADEEYLKNLRTECANKASEWEQRQKNAADEQEALAKAIEILTG